MERRIALGGALVLATFIWVFATTHKAKGHEHEGVNYSEWKDSRGYSCCNDSDCQPTVGYSNDDGSWTAMFQGRKVIVPMEKILRIPSPDGRSHICMSPTGSVPYCFVGGEPRS